MDLIPKNRLIYVCLVASMAFLMNSCDTAPKNPKDPVAIAEDHNDAKFNTDKKDDADFLVDLTEISLEEIRIAKLAQEQGMSKDVKELGKKMEEAHQKSLAELKKLAKEKSVTVPDSLDTSNETDYRTLTAKSGNEFDKSFCDMLTESHKKAIEKCEKASTDAEDIDVKNWANKTLPELRAHLDIAMNCGEKYKH